MKSGQLDCSARVSSSEFPQTHISAALPDVRDHLLLDVLGSSRWCRVSLARLFPSATRPGAPSSQGAARQLTQCGPEPGGGGRCPPQWPGERREGGKRGPSVVERAVEGARRNRQLLRPSPPCSLVLHPNLPPVDNPVHRHSLPMLLLSCTLTSAASPSIIPSPFSCLLLPTSCSSFHAGGVVRYLVLVVMVARLTSKGEFEQLGELMRESPKRASTSRRRDRVGKEVFCEREQRGQP